MAAVVVVVHHCLLTWPVLAEQYVVANPASATWWLTFTPLHLVWAGTEAVLVFFVLSGFVLAGPFLHRVRRTRWAAYYGARLLRLYLPVWSSLALAIVLVVAFPRHGPAEVSWWFSAHDVPPDAGTAAADAVLLGGVSWVHKSLWSLQYEVLFSLALPLYVYLAGRRSPWWVLGVFSLVLVGLGQVLAWDALSWLAVFGVGVSLASGRVQLRLLAVRWNSSQGGTLRWIAVAVLATALLLTEWWGRAWGLPLAQVLVVARPAAALGAALVVVLAMGCPAVSSLLCAGPAQWAGRVSFSLYLVHEPIVVSVASIAGGSRSGVVVTLAVGIPMAAGVAVAFHRWIELPAQRVARRVATSTQRRAAADAPPSVRSPSAPRPAVRTVAPVTVAAALVAVPPTVYPPQVRALQAVGGP